MLREFRSALWCAAAILGVSTSVAAQATAYVPVDDAVYSYISAIQARGGLRSLWSLERPYTAGELASALSADSVSMEFPKWRAAIQRAIARYDLADSTASRSSFRTAVAADAFVTAQTTGNRELMLADGADKGGGYPGVSLRLVAGTGNVVAAGRLIGDRRLRADPQFGGEKDRPITGRPEDGYFLIAPRFAQLAVGRLARDWGPATVGGLQVGTAAATYDHLYGRLGSSRVRLSALVARLSDHAYGTDSIARRYFSAHRLAIKLGAFEIAGTETMVYGGRGQGMAPPIANPLLVFIAAQYNENTTGNSQVGLDVLLRTKRVGQFGVQLMLDDYQIDDCDPGCNEPPSYGASFVAEGVPLFRAHRGFASYTRLTNLAYRTPAPHEAHSHLNVGLGRGFTDYDEWRVGVETTLLPWMPLRVYGAHRRQGQGDYRLPFPSEIQYATTPTFLSGVVMTVNRLGVRGAAVTRLADVEGDVGINSTRNALHVVGATKTAFQGRLKVAIRSPWLWRSLDEVD